MRPLVPTVMGLTLLAAGGKKVLESNGRYDGHDHRRVRQQHRKVEQRPAGQLPPVHWDVDAGHSAHGADSST